MDRTGNTTTTTTNSNNTNEHIIDIPSGNVFNSNSVSTSQQNDRPSTSDPAPNPNPNSQNNSNYTRNRRSPLNSGLWISIEVIANVSQIIAAVIVLSLSRNEKPQAPLFEWVIGYTVGCFATLPHLYWRYIHRNIGQNSGQDQANTGQTNPNGNSATFLGVSGSRTSEGETSRDRALNAVAVNPRINALFDHFKMALDCFFAVWFVVGNVWIFGGHSSAANAPNLYRLCIVFLTFSCIGYAMPFILCGVICCCLPCIISVMGFREDMLNQSRGATSESINALPTYKFKSNKRRSRNSGEAEGEGGGGVFAPGTDKERAISAEDAVCCICLGKYANNDELRELPCTHFFHKDCVDKWLKINALCPLCKADMGHPSTS